VHTDLDGTAAGLVLKEEAELVKELHRVDYPASNCDNIIQKAYEDPEPSCIYVADFAPTQQGCELLKKGLAEGKFLKVMVCDHHNTTKELATHYEWFHHSDNLCGAEVLAHAIDSEVCRAMTQWLQVVRVYDLWLLDSPLRKFAEQVNELHFFLGATIFENIARQCFLFTNWSFFPLEELPINIIFAAIQMRQQDMVQKAIKEIQVCTDTEGTLVAYVTSSANPGKLADAALPALVEKHGAIYLAVVKPQFGKVELRSLGDVDVSLKTKRRGGGGHKKAAGYEYQVTQAPLP